MTIEDDVCQVCVNDWRALITAATLHQMPRALRLQVPGLFHLGATSVSSRALFYDNRAHELFFRLLNKAFERYSLNVVSYCLLSTHYHLLVRTTEPDLSRSLQWLNGCFGARLNAMERDRGHVFGARFWSRRIASDADLLATTRYIARNPVEAGLCRDPADWCWSSYSVLIRGLRRPPFLDPAALVDVFGGDERAAIPRLRGLVEDVTVAPAL